MPVGKSAPKSRNYVPDNRLQGLNNLEKVKEDIARDSNGSINYLLDWMERNPDKLEGTVHKPPMISVNVRDKDLAWQIEACTNLSQRSASASSDHKLTKDIHLRAQKGL